MKKKIIIGIVVLLLCIFVFGSNGEESSTSSDNPSEGAKAVEVQESVADSFEAEDEAKDDGTSLAQKNALRSAESYLSVMAFSYSGLIEQLEYEGYSPEDATWAVDNCKADWNEQAALKAQEYLDTMPFSRAELIDQLLYEGFTQEQAEYGVTEVGY